MPGEKRLGWDAKSRPLRSCWVRVKIMADDSQTTDLLARLRQHSGPAIMGCTCRSDWPNCPACDCGHAANEIGRLRTALEQAALRFEMLAIGHPGATAEAGAKDAREALNV